MTFDEWWRGTNYAPTNFYPPPITFDEFQRRIKTACKDAWDAGLEEGMKAGIRHRHREYLIPDEPASTESKTITLAVPKPGMRIIVEQI